MNKKFDIAIIGGGPSGCACALALHNSGLKVVLIDKDVFPRDKICGDAIPGPSFKAMDYIHPTWGDRMRSFADKKEIRTSIIFAPNGKKVELNWITYAYNSKRLNFDNFLYRIVQNETNTTCINNRLENVNVQNEMVRCILEDGSEITTSIVIGCDGAYSMVRRMLDTKHGLDKPQAVAVRAYYKNVRDINEDVNEFHFFKAFPGYFWIFPLPYGEANVGFGIAQNPKNDSINLSESLEYILTKIPRVASRFTHAEPLDKIKEFSLPIWTKKQELSGNRFMLCGDAASLTDPMQGHGIDKGMWSGIYAAQQAMDCFRQNRFDAKFISHYDERVFKQLGTELKRSAFFMRTVLKFPRLVNAMVWVGQQQNLTAWFARKLKI